jgi:PTS system mannose-specific IIB component/fructoselysine and glucoselysine-specific PTS system IIB component
MAILLYRIDDRLVHGQVILGWGRPLGIDFILLVDDQVRESPWEQDLYRMGVPAGIEIIFASRAEAVIAVPRYKEDSRRGIVLAGEIGTITALSRAGVIIPALNLGGIHHNPGRTERLPYLYLTDEELKELEALQESGVEISAQDLPTANPVPLRSLA